MDVYALIHNLLHGAVVILLVFILYVIIFYVKKHILEYWIVRAVNAAEIMFTVPGSGAEKKEWVINFLKDNGFTKGVSEEQLNTLIEAAVNSMNIQKHLGAEAEHENTEKSEKKILTENKEN